MRLNIHKSHRAKSLALAAVLLSVVATLAQNSGNDYNEPWRPQFHFSPRQHWMNDPNGLVYFNNTYHLFFQYYPEKSVWGPMHWGHATSPDMLHWTEQPIALYPDSLGYIFSGSAVVDSNNTSGFGRGGKIPLVAIFTHHYPNPKPGQTDFQNQSLAYSLDGGSTWTKYAGNPVLKNPGIIDFRDPKVSWYAPAKKWIMALATKDRITFYSSPNLRNWSRESDFGAKLGAHGGVWECPDLFPLNYNGKQVWVLLVSINPGAPDGGSGTQYFVGDFDGHQFRPYDTSVRWIDRGRDNYAGVTWSNTGPRKLFIGWMSNWAYAQQVPTQKWRSANTIPCELGLGQVNGKFYLRFQPVKELADIEGPPIEFSNSMHFMGQGRIKLKLDKQADFSIVLSNDSSEKLVAGFDRASNSFYIDRSQAGISDFNDHFAEKYMARRISEHTNMELTLIIDQSSIELFGDDGLNVMSCLFFSRHPLRTITFQSPSGAIPSILEMAPIERTWGQ